MLNFARMTMLIAALGLGSPTVFAQSTGPDALVKQTVEELLRIIRSDKEVQAGNVERIAQIMEEKVAPHFDFPRMTRLAVGRSWRDASAGQREAIIREFRTLLVRSYSAAFTFYKGIAVEYKPLRMNAGDTEATVNTLIRLPGGAPPIAVDYDMSQNDGAWKVYDVRVDGASLVINYRNLFSQEIERGGLDGLLKSLTEKNVAPAPTAKKQ